MPSREAHCAYYHGLMATAIMPPDRMERARPAAMSVHLGFRLGPSTLSLEVADAEALRLIEEAYAPLRCPLSGPRTNASVRRLSDGRLHLRYGRQALRPANAVDAVPLRAAYHAAREIFARFACEPPHTLAIYGALCAIDGGAVLLLGPTTIGKTLLSLHLAAQGARFLGDETALLSLVREEAYALPRRPALRDSALPLLPDARMAQSIAECAAVFSTERGRFWYALEDQALSGIEPSAHAYPLRAVCVLGSRGESPKMRRLDASDAVKFVAQRAYARPTSLAQIGTVRRALRRAAFFEMTLGDPSESARMLIAEVRSCA